MIDIITELTEGPNTILSDCTEEINKLYRQAQQRFAYDIQQLKVIISLSHERFYMVNTDKPALYKNVLLEPWIVYSKSQLLSLFEEKNNGKQNY